MGNSQGSNLTPAQVAKWRDMVLVNGRLTDNVAFKDAELAKRDSQFQKFTEVSKAELKEVVSENKKSLDTIATLQSQLAESEKIIEENSWQTIKHETVHEQTILTLQKELEESKRTIEENQQIHLEKTAAQVKKWRDKVLETQHLEKDVAKKDAEIATRVADSLRLSQLLLSHNVELTDSVADNKKSQETIVTLQNQLTTHKMWIENGLQGIEHEKRTVITLQKEVAESKKQSIRSICCIMEQQRRRKTLTRKQYKRCEVN